MNSIIKSIRHIHIQEISKIPKIYQAIITYEIKEHYNSNEDWEQEQKTLVNKLINEKWNVNYECSYNRDI